jgi:hypothetical protein
MLISGVCDLRHLGFMCAVRTPSQLGHLDGDELERLVVLWRSQALPGDWEACRIFHALEAEQRLRLRPSQMALLRPECVTIERHQPWWKFWSQG